MNRIDLSCGAIAVVPSHHSKFQHSHGVSAVAAGARQESPQKL